MTDVVIDELHGLDEMNQLRATAGAVWGGAAADMVSADFLMALAHGGGYVVGARSGDRMVGCSFGFLARHDGDWCLHSHITGVIPQFQNSGLGHAIKSHQFRWAADHGLRAITWTFDPLVRRNGWFNLRKLGARAVEYHVDFYGALDDDINGSGETDRLLARWEVAGTSDTGTEPTTEVPTPDDIVTLRRTDPTAAHRWRLDMRERLAPLMARNVIVGMNERGDYLVQAKERGS